MQQKLLHFAARDISVSLSSLLPLSLCGFPFQIWPPHLCLSELISLSLSLFALAPSICVSLHLLICTLILFVLPSPLPAYFLFFCALFMAQMSLHCLFLSVPVRVALLLCLCRTVCRLLAMPRRHGTWLRHPDYK